MTQTKKPAALNRSKLIFAASAMMLSTLAGCSLSEQEAPQNPTSAPKAQSTSENTIAPNKPIAWQQGPETATQPPSERPPNIVFILIDDLGINDLSTFGGGVAGGRAPTPNIDRLAERGVVLTTTPLEPPSCFELVESFHPCDHTHRTSLAPLSSPESADRPTSSVYPRVTAPLKRMTAPAESMAGPKPR